MRKLVALFFAFTMMLAFATSAMAETKKYLRLGEDPQSPNRQPTAEEEVFVSNEDLCDSGWGTGSGMKVPGCYPKGTAAIRNKTTRIVAAIYFCGNEPSDIHLGLGKSVPETVRIQIERELVVDPNAITRNEFFEWMNRLMDALEKTRPTENFIDTRNWYLRWWDNHPIWAGVTHLAVIGAGAYALSNQGDNNNNTCSWCY